MTSDFSRELLALGIFRFEEQARLWDVVKHFALVCGVPLGGGLATLGAKAGTVSVPGIGTVSGAAVGFLVGFAVGTATCTALNYSMQDELRSLAQCRR
jgi:hypothetical protein